MIRSGMQHAPLQDNQAQANTHKIEIGFTPTMGALHNGHKSLMEANVAQNHIAIASIFVNPTQFAPGEDLSTYPRTIDHDRAMCEEVGIDIIFLPTPEVMYAESDEVSIEPPKKMGYILEGYHRPTHFRGVLQVVLKLFCLVTPSRAYFGQKDAQQLLIIQKMVRQLCLPIEIVGMPIVRDSDMLALSSRNVYLSQEERKMALAIPQTIAHIYTLITQHNERDITRLKQEAERMLQSLTIDYAEFYTHDLCLAPIARDCLFLLAVRVGKVRLLDNLWIQ